MLGFGPLGRFPLGENSRSTGISASASITLDAVTLSSAATVALKGTLTKTLDDATLAATGTVALKAAAAITLADVALSTTGTVALKGALTATLDNVSLSFTAALQIKANIVVTLDDITTGITGDFGTTITDTEVLQMPIDCVLAGEQPYRERVRTHEIGPKWTVEQAIGKTTRARRLSRAAPSFTVKTGTRGYD